MCLVVALPGVSAWAPVGQYPSLSSMNAKSRSSILSTTNYDKSVHGLKHFKPRMHRNRRNDGPRMVLVKVDEEMPLISSRKENKVSVRIISRRLR
jgi:hypothetical protein